MGSVARFNLAGLVSRHEVVQYIETGFGNGDACRNALDAGIERALSCDTRDTRTPLVSQAARLEVVFADGIEFLASAQVRRALAEHRSVVFVGAPETDGASTETSSACLLGKIEALRGNAQNALILIDDMRAHVCDFPQAVVANPARSEHTYADEARFLALFDQFDDSHILQLYADDSGYVALWPRSWGEYDLATWVLPGDLTQPLGVSSGVPGTTCISLNRRLQDARFASRWLVGRGLDIGGGEDSIALYRRLFPRVESVTVYERAQGDAQYLRNVQDGSFDFVYSAHCLEHMVDPRVALRHWLRVVKPGGHLVISVPDEDMYEQGVWPSTFNADHKHTFAMFKRESWSPVSINVLDLLREFEQEVEIAKIERLDHAFLPDMQRFDQTRTAFAECAIEFVLRKL